MKVHSGANEQIREDISIRKERQRGRERKEEARKRGGLESKPNFHKGKKEIKKEKEKTASRSFKIIKKIFSLRSYIASQRTKNIKMCLS